MRTKALTRSSSVDTTWRSTPARATAWWMASSCSSAGGQQAAAELGVARVDEQLLAGLGVLDDQQPGVGQLVLPTVDQPDGDHLVPVGQPQQRPLPARLADEVGDDHDQRPAAEDAGGRVEQAAQVGDRAVPPTGRSSSRTRTSTWLRPCRGGMVRWTSLSYRMAPTRLPPRTSSWPKVVASSQSRPVPWSARRARTPSTAERSSSSQP